MPTAVSRDRSRGPASHAPELVHRAGQMEHSKSSNVGSGQPTPTGNNRQQLEAASPIHPELHDKDMAKHMSLQLLTMC
eukprot:81988-Chlamydomonas_euryale.AAC.3